MKLPCGEGSGCARAVAASAPVKSRIGSSRWSSRGQRRELRTAVGGADHQGGRDLCVGEVGEPGVKQRNSASATARSERGRTRVKISMRRRIAAGSRPRRAQAASSAAAAARRAPGSRAD